MNAQSNRSTQRLFIAVAVMSIASCSSEAPSPAPTSTIPMTPLEVFLEDLPDVDPTTVRGRAPSVAWDGYVAAHEPVSPSTDPALDAVLKEKLYDADGELIIELKHRNGPKPVAYAACAGTKPAIVYSAEGLSRMTEYSLPFVREHERAHHLRRHVRCADVDNPVPPPAPGEEQRADCDAVAVLQQKGPHGETLIIVAADRLAGAAGAGDHIHPPDQVRSQYVLRRCAGM